MIDPEQKFIYRIEVSADRIPAAVDEKADAFLIMLRRQNSKVHALDFLRSLILNKHGITTLSFVLSKIAEVYKLALSAQKYITFHPTL